MHNSNRYSRWGLTVSSLLFMMRSADSALTRPTTSNSPKNGKTHVLTFQANIARRSVRPAPDQSGMLWAYGCAYTTHGSINANMIEQDAAKGLSKSFPEWLRLSKTRK